MNQDGNLTRIILYHVTNCNTSIFYRKKNRFSLTKKEYNAQNNSKENWILLMYSLNQTYSQNLDSQFLNNQEQTIFEDEDGKQYTFLSSVSEYFKKTRKVFDKNTIINPMFEYQSTKSKEEIEQYLNNISTIKKLRKGKKHKRIDANKGWITHISLVEDFNESNTYELKQLELLLRQ